MEAMASNKPSMTLDMINEMCIKDGYEWQIPFGLIRLHVINYFDNKRHSFTFKSCIKVVNIDFFRALIEGHFQHDHKLEGNDIVCDLYMVFVMVVDKTIEKLVMLILYDMT